MRRVNIAPRTPCLPPPPTTKMALIIIDMQVGFDGARAEWTVDAIVEEIEAANRLNIPIGVVELHHFGNTINRITDATAKRGANAHLIMKSQNDGSNVIARHHAFRETELFIVTGINSFACVGQTVQGLRHYHARKVVVPSNATNQMGASVVGDDIECHHLFCGITIHNGSMPAVMEFACADSLQQRSVTQCHA